MGFPGKEFWSGLPFPSPGDLPDPRIAPVFPALPANYLPLSHHGCPLQFWGQLFILSPHFFGGSKNSILSFHFVQIFVSIEWQLPRAFKLGLIRHCQCGLITLAPAQAAPNPLLGFLALTQRPCQSTLTQVVMIYNHKNEGKEKSIRELSWEKGDTFFKIKLSTKYCLVFLHQFIWQGFFF